MDVDVIGRVVRVGVVGRRWTGGKKRDDLVLATVGRLLFAHHDWIFIFLLAMVACHLAWSCLSAGLFLPLDKLRYCHANGMSSNEFNGLDFNIGCIWMD